MPHSLKHDIFVVACAEAFEIQMQELHEKFMELSYQIELITNNETLIDFLAYERHVDFYENLTLEEKRNVVKAAKSVHRKKGTKFALEQIFKLLNLQGRINEWFEYEGDPFHFKAQLNVSNAGVNEETILLLERLVMTYKNNRSVLENLDVFLTSVGNSVFAGAYLMVGEEITVYPYQSSTLVSKGVIRTAAAHNNDIETITLYPKED